MENSREFVNKALRDMGYDPNERVADQRTGYQPPKADNSIPIETVAVVGAVITIIVLISVIVYQATSKKTA